MQALPLPSYVILDNLFNLSLPPSPYLLNGDNATYIMGLI